jgi:hypothetical protein
MFSHTSMMPVRNLHNEVRQLSANTIVCIVSALQIERNLLGQFAICEDAHYQVWYNREHFSKLTALDLINVRTNSESASMPLFTTSSDSDSVTVQTSDLILTFSLDDGSLRALRHIDRSSVIGYGAPRPAIDLQVGVDGIWLAERIFVRYLHHTIDERDGAVEVVIVTGIGPLVVYDRYRITGTLIARRITIKNVSEDELQLSAVRMVVPWARIDEAEMCRFEAPGNSVRPHVPLVVAAAQRQHVLPRRFFAPGLRNNSAFEEAPTVAAGLLALHNALAHESLLCWYYSEVEPAYPYVDGNDSAVTLAHEIQLADRLRPEVAISGGVQYLLLLRESWPAALASFRQTLPITGLKPPAPPVAWAQDAAIYEVYPAAFGGFAGLMRELGSLRALGINTLCLLPIWSFDNRREQPWDDNWDDSGDPYALRDFEIIEASLGSPSELRMLIDAAHAHGLRVLVDLPLIGCDAQSRHVAEHPEWFCRNTNDELITNPSNPAMCVFNWANADLQRYLLDQALDQARIYGFDGYRAVAPRRAAQNWATRFPHHASAGSLGVVQWLGQLRKSFKQMSGDYALLGVFGGPIYDTVIDFACDEMTHHMLLHTALNRMQPTDLGEWLRDHRQVACGERVRVCFTESYATRLLNPLADGLRGSRISRMLLAGIVLCGFVPMLRCGQEYGEEAFLMRLLHMREQYTALRRGQVDYTRVNGDAPHLFCVLRTYEGQLLIGVLNFGPHKRAMTLQLPLDTLPPSTGYYTLVDVLNDREWVEEGRRTWQRDDFAALRLTFAPFEAYFLLVCPASHHSPADASSNCRKTFLADAIDESEEQTSAIAGKGVRG